MAFTASLAKIHAEASCPICLDHLRDPVTTECGHNFCSSCIHQRWEGLQGTFPCPVCLHHCPDRSLKRNTQLCHMTEIVQQIPTMRGKRKRQEEPLCKKHREVLSLFCEKDLQLQCAQCRVSSNHQDGPLIPIEEAVATHRKMLKSHIENKTNHLRVVEMLYENQVKNTLEVKEKMRKWREELDSECKQLKCFLAIERNEVDNDLFIEEEDVIKKLIENRRQISSHIFKLNHLLYEIEEKCLQTDPDLLAGIESIHDRYENLLRETEEKRLQTDPDLLTGIESIHNRSENLETPAIFSCDLKKGSYNLPPNYLGLHKIIRKFLVDLRLDPETAHPNVIISGDRRKVSYQRSSGFPDHQDPTSCLAVLSSEGIDAGRHFWAVEIQGTGECFLGVCKESFPSNTHILPLARNGCWQYSLWISPSDLIPIGKVKIGIFLDYELGEVSFYNLNDCSYLHGITDTFTETLMPYFSIAVTSESLKISIIRRQ